MGLDSVLADLESEGYQQQVFLIPACAVGAYHRRDRVWILAHSDSGSSASAQQKREYEGAENDSRSSHDELDAGTIMADAASKLERKRIAGRISERESTIETIGGLGATGTAVVAKTVMDSGNDVADTLQRGTTKGGRELETLKAAGRNEKNSLPDAVNVANQATGSLNPQWVEWLMGFPEGWTDLNS
jgi:site-specific DNA-cytosine methylase